MLTEHILRRLAVGKSTKKGSYFLFRGYPKGIQSVTVMVFIMQMYHSLTLR